MTAEELARKMADDITGVPEAFEPLLPYARALIEAREALRRIEQHGEFGDVGLAARSAAAKHRCEARDALSKLDALLGDE